MLSSLALQFEHLSMTSDTRSRRTAEFSSAPYRATFHRNRERSVGRRQHKFALTLHSGIRQRDSLARRAQYSELLWSDGEIVATNRRFTPAVVAKANVKILTISRFVRRAPVPT
jgi:hypothetical protein